MGDGESSVHRQGRGSLQKSAKIPQGETTVESTHSNVLGERHRDPLVLITHPFRKISEMDEALGCVRAD
jgi:hypothetical protein